MILSQDQCIAHITADLNLWSLHTSTDDFQKEQDSTENCIYFSPQGITLCFRYLEEAGDQKYIPYASVECFIHRAIIKVRYGCGN